MSFKKTLVLAVILALSVLYLTKVSFPARERELSKDALFPAFDKNQIASVAVARRPLSGAEESFGLINSKPAAAPPTPTPSGGELTETSSDSGSWSIATLPGAVIDSTALNSFLSALGAVKFAGVVDEEAVSGDFSEYGLDKPALTLVIKGPAEQSTEVAFGKKNQYLNQRYAKVSGRSGIHLLEESSFSLLDKGKADLRSKTPVSINEGDVREFALQSKAGRVKVQQIATGEWKIVEPLEKPASSTAVADLIRAVTGLRASEFLDGANAQDPAYGFDRPAATLTVTFRDGVEPKAYEVRVAKGKAQGVESSPVFFVHTGAPSVYKSLSDPLESLELSPDKIRERRLFTFGVDGVSKVIVAGPGIATVEIVDRDKDGYQVNGKQADPVFAEQVLENIISLKAADFPSSADASAFKEPKLIITIARAEASADTQKLIVGAEARDKAGALRYYAKVGDAGEAVLIAEEDYKRLVAREETLLAPTPTPVQAPPGEATAVP